MSMDYQNIEGRPRVHEGYRGMFTRSRAPGAYPNGTRIIKTELEGGDLHPVGSTATVLGSMPTGLRSPKPSLIYFVEWDDHPHVAVAVISSKIMRAQ